MTDFHTRPPRDRKGDVDRCGELYDLPSSEIDGDDGRPDPWWLMPASFLMWMLVAVGVVILMTALVS